MQKPRGMGRHGQKPRKGSIQVKSKRGDRSIEAAEQPFRELAAELVDPQLMDQLATVPQLPVVDEEMAQARGKRKRHRGRDQARPSRDGKSASVTDADWAGIDSVTTVPFMRTVDDEAV